MSDWNTPALTSTYTSFLDGLKGRDVEVAQMFATDVVSSMSNWPARAVRFNATNNNFQRRNAANNGWESLTTNFAFPAITITGSGTLTVGGDITGASIDVSGKSEAGYFNTTATTVPPNGINEPSSNVLGLCSDSAVRWGITGNILHRGTSALVTGDSTANFQIHHSSGPTLSLIRNDTSLVAGDRLGKIMCYGNDTTSNSYRGMVAIMFDADGTHSAGDNPTRIEFQTTADGSDTLRTVGCFDEDGRLGIGEDIGTSPSCALDVDAKQASIVAKFWSNTSSSAIILNSNGVGSNNVQLKGVGNNLHLHSNSTTTPSAIFNENRYLLMGHTDKYVIGSDQAKLQVFGTSNSAAINLSRWSSDTTAPQLRFGKSRGAIGVQTALLNGDDLGRIMYYGSDGTDTSSATFQILVDVDGSVANPTDFSGVTIPIATGSVPTRFSLANTPIGNTSTRNIMQADNWGHWRITPKANDGNHNEYCIDIRTHNSGGTGNMIRFTDTDTSAADGQVVGGLEFASLDTGAVPTGGVLGKLFVDEDDGTPHGRMKFQVGGALRAVINGETGNFGIGTGNGPTQKLHVEGRTRSTTGFLAGDSSSFINYGTEAYIQTGGNSSAEASIAAGLWSDSAGQGGTLFLTKARSSGTLTFNDAANGLHSGDVLGVVSFRGSDGNASNAQTGAQIYATATEDWSDGSRGTELNFQTASNGGTNGTKMVLRPDGKLIIGDSSGNDFWNNDSDSRLQVVDGSGGSLLLVRNDSSVNTNDNLGEIAFTDDDPGGTYNVSPSVKIHADATQAHSATSRGARFELFTTQNSTVSPTRRLTINHNGTWGVGSNGQAYGSTGEVMIKTSAGYPDWEPVGARAWANFDGSGTVSIRRNYNVSSITDNGVGKWTLSFTNNLPSVNNVPVAWGMRGTASDNNFSLYRYGAQSNSEIEIRAAHTWSGGGDLEDMDYVYVAIFA